MVIVRHRSIHRKFKTSQYLCIKLAINKKENNSDFAYDLDKS